MTPAIPRLFHWIWFGDKPLPEQHRAWIEGWLALHPGWEHVLWTDENRPTLVNESEFLVARSFAQKADIARYELVYRQGGVYVDTDTECLRSIEPLLDGVAAFAAEHRPGTVQNHPFGATRSHPWLAETIARLPAAMKARDGGHHGTGPRFLTMVTRGRDDVKIFPSSVFFSQPARAERDVPAGAYAVHHATRSWGGASDGPSRRRLAGASDAPHRSKLAELVRLDLESVVPPGAAFVLVGKDLPLEVSGGRRAVPFPEQDGEWAGYPADDADAIAVLARACAGGARFVVVPRPMAYWLEIYPGLADYLRTRATVRLDNDRALIVELGEGS
jgi:hypothetical protein